jgi:hypothetical protein
VCIYVSVVHLQIISARPVYVKSSLSNIKTFIISVMGLYECCVSRICCAYFEFGLFDHIVCVLSLCLVLKFLPVCPM